MRRPCGRRSRRVETALDGSGRLLIRPSGTEPLIRVMVEGDDLLRVERLAREIADAIGKEIERLAETYAPGSG